MRRIWCLLFGFFMGTTLLVASVPEDSYASALTYTVPQIAAALSKAAVELGGQQQIQVQIDEVQERRISLILIVTYPNGEIARSLHYIEHGAATIAWMIPADATLGEATFQLIVNGCSCGEHNTIPQQSTVAGRVEGTFMIGRPPKS